MERMSSQPLQVLVAKLFNTSCTQFFSDSAFDRCFFSVSLSWQMSNFQFKQTRLARPLNKTLVLKEKI